MTQQDDSIQIVPDPDKLDRYHRQQLSAMLDGELSPDQARFMLRRLQHDVELADCWERWQLWGDLLRGQHNALLPPDFAQKVSAAVAAGKTPLPAAEGRPAAPRLLRWGGGAALAASVAMAALLIGRQAGPGPGEEQSQAYAELAHSGQPAVADTASAAVAAGPEPAPPPAVQAAPALAGAALAAAAQASRRTGAHSAAGQRSERPPADPSSSLSRPVGEAPRAVATAPGPAPADPPAGAGVDAGAPEPGAAEAGSLFAGLTPVREGIGSDPFRALPMTTASRPWPRANPGAVEDYAVGLGGAVLSAPAWPGRPVAQRHTVAELFGLPPEAASQLPSATAIGARAFGAADAARAPAAYPGPR